MAVDSKSIRELALERLKTLLGTMSSTVIPPTIVANPALEQVVLRHDLEAANVIMGPLTEVQFKKNFAVGILEGEHTLNHQMTVDTNLLGVTLEVSFRMPSAADTDGSAFWNSIITDIHRLLRSDPDLAGLVARIEILGDSVDVDSFLDKKIDGAVFIRLNYKTAENDPRQIVPGVFPS